MNMTIAWILMLTQGEYEDRRTIPLGVYTHKGAADCEARKINSNIGVIRGLMVGIETLMNAWEKKNPAPDYDLLDLFNLFRTWSDRKESERAGLATFFDIEGRLSACCKGLHANDQYDLDSASVYVFETTLHDHF